MAQPPDNDSALEADFEAIAAAVNETERGRWFLTEFARRNRHADTQLVLDAVARLEASLAERSTAATTEQFRHDIVIMSEAIARTKAEIAAIRPQGEGLGKIGDAGVELDAIVETTERATSDILAAAERIQEIAWALREQGVDSSICDLLDLHTAQTYTACSFQDLTGQRIRKIVDVLNFLEARIEAMNRIWQHHPAPAATAPAGAAPSLTNGPAQPGEALEQETIDAILESSEPPAVDPAEDIFWQDIPVEEAARGETTAALAATAVPAGQPSAAPAARPAPETPDNTADRAAAAEPVALAASPLRRTGTPKAAAPSPDPIEALTPAERLALFS